MVTQLHQVDSSAVSQPQTPPRKPGSSAGALVAHLRQLVRDQCCRVFVSHAAFRPKSRPERGE